MNSIVSLLQLVFPHVCHPLVNIPYLCLGHLREHSCFLYEQSKSTNQCRPIAVHCIQLSTREPGSMFYCVDQYAGGARLQVHVLNTNDRTIVECTSAELSGDPNILPAPLSQMRHLLGRRLRASLHPAVLGFACKPLSHEDRALSRLDITFMHLMTVMGTGNREIRDNRCPKSSGWHLTPRRGRL